MSSSPVCGLIEPPTAEKQSVRNRNNKIARRESSKAERGNEKKWKDVFVLEETKK